MPGEVAAVGINGVNLFDREFQRLVVAGVVGLFDLSSELVGSASTIGCYMPPSAVPELICPSCRRPPEAWPVSVESGECTNPACQEVHPALAGTGIRVVVAGSRESFLDELNDELRFDVEADVTAWLDGMERGGASWEEAARLGMYADLHYRQEDSALDRLYQRFIEPLTATIESALDLGCGLGRFASIVSTGLGCHVTGLDSWPLALRFAHAATKHRQLHLPTMGPDAELAASPFTTPHELPTQPVLWVCGDVHNPPLPAAGFDLVTAINVFDSVGDPALALGQASALLRPGGLLLMAQPDSWNAAATPPSGWVSSSSAAWELLMAEYGFETIDREDGFEWTLTRNARTYFRYVSHARLAILGR